ncbi:MULTISPECIES: FAD-dependent oxidoreductase [unclassified Crossiella]|uniref:GcvT family protein n=1 Tax=unclassified Crossiella TaxID=2620835 RepID=UPI001FFEFD77|nr:MULTISPECIES: FAD-dependent oxidoreductase [unclassified Crossiella]MCK2238797.1 FAD-dependent oxidoreductase [Crossiella sp. S99.2]MCK2251633.1 FAD-dependent oxidoreductase [Crossiella sp. S99.1]
MDRTLPARARIVVIGGGVGGTSIAYHLAKLGERDVVLLDRDELTSGSTFHSAGLVGQLRADVTLTRMNIYSAQLYAELEAGENPVGFVPCGGIRLACTPERMDEARRQIGWSRTVDLPLQEISPAEAKELFPLLDTSGVLGGTYLATDGYVDPAQLTYSLAAGARAGGVRIFPHTRVLGIDVREGRVRGVRTERGDIEAEIVVNCGGMFAAEIGRLAGVRVPIVPMSHQYLITEPVRPRDGSHLPTLRDPDNLVYFREEVDGLLMGGYERDSAPWAQTGANFEAVPPDFNGKLLPEDWDRFAEIAEAAQLRVPTMATAGIRKMINGPEAFTPDNEFCLGETEVGGFFVAAGFCAHGIAGAGGIGKVMAEWIVAGEPEFDLSHMDIRRFGRQYRSPGYTRKRTVENYETYYDIPFPHRERGAGRPLRVSSAYPWHREHEASFGEKSGWERVNHYERNAAAGQESWRPHGWAGRNWSPAIGAEHLGTRERAGLFDESSFAKIEVTGPGAAKLLDWVCANEVAGPVGAITYTQALNARGGIECDFTVTRWGEHEFQVVTGTAFGSHDAAWLRRHAPADGSVRIADVTGAWSCFALWGPRSREILAGLTPAALDNEAFPYLTAQETTVGDVPVRALRVTFAGELGWELYCSSEYGAALWRTLWEAGQEHGVIAGGYRAIDSLRLEKGYRLWGSDLTPERTPYEAGLGFCVKPDKPGGFHGREALLRRKEAGFTHRLRCLTLDDPLAWPLGSEAVRVGGEVLGRVTTGGYGYSVGRAIAFCYLPVDRVKIGTEVEVEIFGRWVPGVVERDPLFDPKGTRIRA